MNHRLLKLFRVLIPSWGFFADVAELPVLFVRTADAAGSWEEWHPLPSRPQRGLLSVIFNPQGNLYLAYNTLLQQVESDIGELNTSDVERFDRSVSFKLLHNLVRYQLRGREGFSQYQFQLERHSQGDAESSAGEIFLTSKIYSV